ncbi:hypothetical protein GCM10009760_55740 [Kitasatospora kazusensis]|uniref:PLL-like beta propeller domain-containing protein n=1 Tax=Kitasatospora kazusensis TaxID=407974 RepID=A0ABN3A8A7_9ACTN
MTTTSRPARPSGPAVKIRAAVVAATIAFGGLAFAAGPAQADSTCQLKGAPYDCSYTVTSVTLPDGTKELFVVGTDHAVWTNWSYTNGSWSGWQSMGGGVESGITVGGKADGGWSFFISATGTDGNTWYRQRSANGYWGPWHLPCPEPDFNSSC